MTPDSLFEFATNRDPCRDYCLWDYPRPRPAEDKFRALNLLLHSFALAGALPRGHAIVEAIREEIGSFRTVFGIKWDGTALAWEFYFYDYRRRDREVSIPRVLHAIAPHHTARIAPAEHLPYFMFSLDIDPAPPHAPRPLDVIHAYVGNPGSTVSSGISYGLRPSGITLENLYFFFDAATQRHAAADKIRSSPFFDVTHCPIAAILLPELVECRTICVANKQTHDCIYFSGVTVDQLLHFLAALSHPPAMIAFLAANRGNFDHLLFDVGFDYRFEDGTLRRLRSGCYGVF